MSALYTAVVKACFLMFAAACAWALDPRLGITTIPLSGDDGTSLTMFAPADGHANGAAVIICPGGAYKALSMNLEGRQVADWFTVRGVTAFVLTYRLGQENKYPIPLEDAKLAMKTVRSSAAQYRLDPNRIGLMGFSAGGHLAAMEAVSADDADRPNFLILGYPWLNAFQPNGSHFITYCSVLKWSEADCKDWERKYTPSLQVTPQTPTTFIFSTSDDTVVPVSASVDFYNAEIAAKIPVEMHLFRQGKHGSGLGASDPSLDQWPVLLESWLRDQGFLRQSK